MKRHSTSIGKKSSLTWLGLVIAMVSGMYTLDGQQPATPMRLDAPMGTAAVSPEGNHIAMVLGRSAQQEDGSWENARWIEIWEPASSKVMAKVDMPSLALFKGATFPWGFISYCDRGRYLAAYDLIDTVYVLDATTYRVESRIGLSDVLRHDPVGTGTIRGLRMACSANASVLVMSAYGGPFGLGVVRLFNLATGEPIAELHQDSSAGETFQDVDLSPDGSKLAVLLESSTRRPLKALNVEIRETRRLKLVRTLSTGDVPRGLIFAGESEIVTVQERPSRPWWPPKQVLRLWDLESGKEERRFSDAQVDVEGPISSSADGKMILGNLFTYRDYRLCNGLEGCRKLVKQQCAVWDKRTGAQIFRSEPFEPIGQPFSARCVLSQNGAVAMVQWPHNVIAPRLFQIRQPGS